MLAGLRSLSACVGLAAAGIVLAACASARRDRQPARLGAVTSWAIQLQGLEHEGAQAALVGARCDLLVLEPTRTVRGQESFATGALVAAVRGSAGVGRLHKLCLAYLNIGQAEDYRSYWGEGWRPPTAAGAGEPDFLLALDPDGWPGNYPVAFWRPEWRALLDAALEQVIADGFDGAFLDWVLAFQEPTVVAAARRAGIDPLRAMVDLLAHLRARARARRADFLFVAQNAGWLVQLAPRAAGLVDAVAQEDLTFRGRAGAAWDDPAGADIATPRAEADGIAAALAACRAHGLTVLTLDYARVPEHAALARARSRALGGVPCISRVALDRLPAEAPAR